MTLDVILSKLPPDAVQAPLRVAGPGSPWMVCNVHLIDGVVWLDIDRTAEEFPKRQIDLLPPG
jgi:hypothetical protein